MATRGQISAEVLRIVEDHVDVVTAAIPTHITRAQRAIEDRCAFAVQEATVSFAVTPLAASQELPADFIAPRKQPYYLARSTDTKYTWLSEYPDFEALGLLTEEGPPKYWRIAGDVNFEVWPIGDELGPSGVTPGGYDVVLPYHKRLDALAADDDTNWFSENLDDVLAWRAAAFVFGDMRDPQANWWSAVAAARFLEFKRQYRRNQIRTLTHLAPAESLSSGRRSFRRADPRLDAKVP